MLSSPALLLIVASLSPAIVRGVEVEVVEAQPPATRPDVAARIVGGNDAALGTWPWQGYLFDVVNFPGGFCGCTLIGEQWAVTSARCVVKYARNPPNLLLAFGSLVRTGEYAPSRVHSSALRIVIHPGYDARVGLNDVALVQLRDILGDHGFSAYVRPVALPASDTPGAGTMCTVTGWGSVNEKGEPAQNLQQAEVPIVGIKQCKQWLGSQNYLAGALISPWQLCAGFENGGVGGCKGDHGGPLVCKKPNKKCTDGTIAQLPAEYVLQGVYSYGHGCGRVRSPSVYTRIWPYINWIRLVTNGETGVRKSSAPPARIVGGTQAEPMAWPWQGFLMFSSTAQLFCGCSLIHAKWAITAAHCLHKFWERQDLRVVFGSRTIPQHGLGLGGRQIAIKRIIIHSHFSEFAGAGSNDVVNDISLIELDTAVMMTKRIRPVSLPSPAALTQVGDERSQGAVCTVTGWGRLFEHGPHAADLQEADVRVVSNAECQKNLSTHDIRSSQLCAGGGGTDTCQGDSGGPLVCKKKGLDNDGCPRHDDPDDYVLEGITSYGIGCATPGLPAVYTRVRSFVSWIKKHTGDDSLEIFRVASLNTASVATEPEANEETSSGMKQHVIKIMPLLLFTCFVVVFVRF